MRGYNLEQTKAVNTIRRANARLKSLYEKYGNNPPYTTELAYLYKHSDWQKYLDTSRGYVQITPPDSGRNPFKRMSESYKHLVNVANLISTQTSYKQEVARQMGVKFTELNKYIIEGYENIKNKLKSRKELLYEYLTPTEFNNLVGSLGNQQGQKRKTYRELIPFLKKINEILAKIEQNNGEIPPI